MNKHELQQILRTTYNRNRCKKVLLEMFPESDMFINDRPTPFTREEQRNLAHHIVQFGEVDLDGDKLIFLEVELKQGSVHLARNRVGLRKLVDNEVVAGLTDGAIITYYQPEIDEWRITFYSEKYGWDEDGKTIKEETHPKRYTYVVGPGESCKTAVGQLINVVQKGRENTLETVLKAFSVQKVSKEFFDEYKKQYDKFVGHLTGKIWTKKGIQIVGERISQFHFYFKATSDHEKEARDFVKKLLGRIVFLYFVQKKHWLGASSTDFKDGNPDFIYELFKLVPAGGKDRFYSQWLTKLFFETLNRDHDFTFTLPGGTPVFIPFLNGGLFERDETDQNTESLPLPGELFSNPKDTESPNTRGFLDFLSAYNFTIHEDSPGDHTIAVDPEMLGHIFENLLEDNKEKGAYYTPKPIVHYMCQESLIEYLLTKLTSDDAESTEKDELRNHLEDLIKKQEAGNLVGFTEEILTALKEVKVCDPAIGSGAFPMGILQEIYQAVETMHHLSPDNVQAIWELPDEKWHPAEVKKQIIQNSIYGVDIEKGAVDIARLRFWLSLIVDEEEPTPLPNLDYKIVVGDSLVSRLKIDGYEQIVNINWDMKGDVSSTKKHLQNLKTALAKIVEKQKAYFDAETEEKEYLKFEIDHLKIEALTHQLHFDREYYSSKTEERGGLLPTAKEIEHNQNRKMTLIGFNELIKELVKRKSNPSSVYYFDWKLDFPEILNDQIVREKGFDIVIANPPYIGEKGNSRVFDELKKNPKWKSFYRRRSNTYYFFIKKGIDLLNNNGVQCLITPREFTNADWANKVRKVITDKTKVLKLIDFCDVKVFDEVGTSSFIILHKACEQRKKYRFYFKLIESDISRLSNEYDYNEKESSLLGITGEKLWQFSQKEIKTEENVVTLNAIYDVSQGIITGADKVTSRHINKGYIDESYLNRGIFILKPNIDYRTSNDNIEVKIHQSWRELNSDDLTFIKPFVKTENLNKWKTTNSKIKLLYVGKASLTKNIKDYLEQFSTVLINRSTTVADDRVINLDEFKTYDKETIKNNYSSAGAVQRVMRSKKWYLPFY